MRADRGTAHAGFVLDALEQGLHERRPLHRGGLVHDSDRGSQHVSIHYTERLAQAGIEPSVGSVGDSYDEALAESINGLYKAEVIHRRGPWRSLEAVEFATLEWVDWFNNRRLLEPIGNILPAEAGALYHAAQDSLFLAASLKPISLRQTQGGSGCGGGFSKSSATHLSCSVARNQGETGCTNRLTIRQDRLEATVIDALRERLMDPAVFAVFVEAFTAEWNRLQSEVSAGLAQQQGELARVERQLEKLVDALADGAPVSMVKDRMVSLEARREELKRSLAGATAPAPRLHPSLAQVYRRKVAELADALAREDGAEVREQLRGLVEGVRLIPEGAELRVEVRGALAAVLALGNEAQNAKNPSLLAGVLVSQIKMDAGTGFGLWRTRLQHA
jgi:hypothetical protein